MAWTPCRQADLRELITFLSKDEWGHVAFSSRLKETKYPTIPQNIYIWRKARKDGDIQGAVLHTNGGLLVPAFSPDFAPDPGGLKSIIFRKKPVRSIDTIMGLKRNVELVQRVLETQLRAAILYHSMILTKPPARITPQDGIICRRGKPRDAGMLYPLQKAYEMEEVLLDPAAFNPGACYLNLQKNLRREIVYYGSLSGKAVAKAGTNARGFTFSQLGGVFTTEEVRNRGVAEQVLAVLLTAVCGRKTGACLFVKKDNHAAIALYKKLGFKIAGEFKIAYYRG